jgi:hypothetical protein
MILNYLCPPALLYAVIMLIYLVLELSNEKYHQAFVKAIVGIIFTCILQAFCQMNLGLISWVFVMIPIIFYTYITLLTFFIFGVNPKKLDRDENTDTSANETTDATTDATVDTSKTNNSSSKWLASKHVSSTPITTSLYTPSIVPFDSYSPLKDTSTNSASNSTSSSSSGSPSSSSSNSGTPFSYSHSKTGSTINSNKSVPVTVCNKRNTATMCNALSVCAWTGKDCINTSEFDSRINQLDASCSSLSDASCNYLDKCYIRSVPVSDSKIKSECLPSIPSIGGLLNNPDCKLLLNQMKFDSSTNTTLSTSIDTKGCSSIANKIYSLLV